MIGMDLMYRGKTDEKWVFCSLRDRNAQRGS